MPQRKYDDALLHDPAFEGGMPQSLIMGTGSGASSTTTLLTAAEDNFTVELWVKPTATHEIDAENAYGISGVSGQKFVIDPVHSGNNTSIAGMGISVGTNGVSVYEHADYYMPALLVWESPTPLTAWTHIAVVYENRQPRLYINGVLVHTGLTSIKTHVYPGNLVASGAYGTMEGQVDEVRVWDHVLTQAQIQAGMNSTAQAPQAGLTAYWPIRQSDGTVLQDISGNNHPVQLNGSYSATNWSSDAAALQSYNKNSYRYAFNGKEKDSDIDQDDYDYGMRISDSRLGRFLSVDPLMKDYANLTPYQYASNCPVSGIDQDGLEFTRRNSQNSPLSLTIGAFSQSYHNTVPDKIVRGTAAGVQESLLNSWNFFTESAWKSSTWKNIGAFIEEAALSLSSVKVTETPRIDAAVKNFERNVINGDAYSRSKWAAGLTVDILTGYVTDKGISQLSRLKDLIYATKLTKGTWITENIKGWSQAAIDYQEYVTGVKAGNTLELEANGVKANFDGIRKSTLLDAKSSYDNFVSKTGEFYNWFKGQEKLVDQARRQIVAANGAPIEWHFSSEKTLQATQKLFTNNNIEGIKLIYNPKL